MVDPSEIPAEQFYFIETAWNEIRLAQARQDEGRRAKAQEHLQEARFFAAKVLPKYTDEALLINIDRALRTFF